MGLAERKIAEFLGDGCRTRKNEGLRLTSTVSPCFGWNAVAAGGGGMRTRSCGTCSGVSALGRGGEACL